jgi:hypothetical protein
MPHGGRRPGAGQPKHQPTDKTRQMVQVLKANGNTHKVIAMVMGIDEKTMMKHYRSELDNGFDQVKSMVGAALVKASLGGNIGAIRYWLACRGGPEWKQRASDEDGGNTTGGATIVIRGGIASVHHEPSDESA